MVEQEGRHARLFVDRRWQLQLAATNHPAHAAMVPMASGAGIGRVGEFHEQGNWYRGGVPRTLFSIWLYGVDNPMRAQIPEGLDPKMRQYLSQYSDLNPKKPDVTWAKQVWHLPYAEMLTSLGEPAGTNEKLISRALPDDPEWFKGGLYHDNEKWGVPALWYEFLVRRLDRAEPRALQSRHQGGRRCGNARQPVRHRRPQRSLRLFASLGPNFKSGDRELGDATLDVNGEVWKFFDRFLKDEAGRLPVDDAEGPLLFDGRQPVEDVAAMAAEGCSRNASLYLRSGGTRELRVRRRQAVLLARRGRVSRPISFVYDPKNPVQTIGGGDCCNGGVVVPGAFDQRPVEVRHDVLVYTSDVLKEPVDGRGLCRCDPARLLGREGHGLRREAGRCRAGRHGLHSRRHHPARALPRGL